jgi:DNA polymerase III alpha subunit
LSYYTAYLRNYYPSEWLAACIQIDRLDEDKVAVLRRECDMERIPIKNPNINESGVETSVNKKGEILLPLSTIKGVGTRSVDIVESQPYESIKDFCYRARPNRGTVAALAEANALCCLADAEEFEYVEDFLVYWDQLVLDRSKEEKQAIRLKKLAEKNSMSYDNIVSGEKKHSSSAKVSDHLLSDELFD